MHRTAWAVCCVALYCRRDKFGPENSTVYCQFQVQIVTKRLELMGHMKTLHRTRPAVYRYFYIVCYFLDRSVSIAESRMYSMVERNETNHQFFSKKKVSERKHYLIFWHIFFGVWERLFASAINEMWPSQNETWHCTKNNAPCNPSRAIPLATEICQHHR